MPSYFDIYVISQDRNESAIEGFLNEFLPIREESADEYPYPQFSENADVTYKDVQKILKMCCAWKSSKYALYWHALENRKPEHAMIIFLKDGHIIFGLSTNDADPEYANEILGMMKIKLKSTLGFIGHEASPSVSDLQEFQAQIEAHIGILDDNI